MNVPGNMTTPRLRLEDGETIALTVEGLRKKGIFGNRFGALVITDRRVAFVKAIMKSGVISAAANKLGAKPMVSFDRASVTAEPIQMKKLTGLSISDGSRTERIAIEAESVDEVLRALAG